MTEPQQHDDESTESISGHVVEPTAAAEVMEEGASSSRSDNHHHHHHQDDNANATTLELKVATENTNVKEDNTNNVVEQSEENNNNNDTEQQQHSRIETGRMPRQWLVDRCDGTSQYDRDRRPPCRLCYVPFVVKYFPNALEQNCFCENLGKVGCIDPENRQARKILFTTAFVMNVIGLLLLIVASFAIADESFFILWNISFTQVWLELIQGPQDYRDTPTFVEMGLRAAAVESFLDDTNEKAGVLSFDAFCDVALNRDTATTTTTDSMARVFVTSYTREYDCDSCQQISQRIVPSLFLSMLSYIPNFTTDILRIYSNYDVNCQKFVASIFSWISLATAIYTWVNYRRGCFDSLDTEPFALNQNLERVDDIPFDGDEGGKENNDDDVWMLVRFQWRAGVGQICLAAATLLKLVDIVINCTMPTPTITRDYMEQVDYECKYGAGAGAGAATTSNHHHPATPETGTSTREVATSGDEETPIHLVMHSNVDMPGITGSAEKTG